MRAKPGVDRPQPTGGTLEPADRLGKAQGKGRRRRGRQKLDAECVILLGSRARGDYHEDTSDIDFITIINGPVSHRDAVRLHYGHHLAFDSIPPASMN